VETGAAPPRAGEFRCGRNGWFSSDERRVGWGCCRISCLSCRLSEQSGLGFCPDSDRGMAPVDWLLLHVFEQPGPPPAVECGCPFRERSVTEADGSNGVGIEDGDTRWNGRYQHCKVEREKKNQPLGGEGEEDHHKSGREAACAGKSAGIQHSLSLHVTAHLEFTQRARTHFALHAQATICEAEVPKSMCTLPSHARRLHFFRPYTTRRLGRLDRGLDHFNPSQTGIPPAEIGLPVFIYRSGR
jgi:hypothetical protein